MAPTFCSNCASILPTPTEGKIVCIACGMELANPPQGVVKVSTVEGGSRANLQLKLGLHEKTKATQTAHAEVDEECPECGHRRATFTTVQLRSVDEGSTVFYTCMECEHKWSTNN